MKLFAAFWVLFLFHAICIVVISLNLFLVLASPTLEKSAYFVIFGAAWSAIYAHEYEFPFTAWAHNVVKEGRKKQ